MSMTWERFHRGMNCSMSFCLSAALAEVAIRQRYVRPELVEESVIEIRGGRHPVVENRLRDEPFGF